MRPSPEPCPPSLIQQVLSPEALQRRAANLARLDDFGPTLPATLSTFCQHFSALELTAQGLRRLAAHVMQALVTRLRLVEALRRTPELFEGHLNEPIIVVGLGRTGTSYLHRLLACLPGRRFLTAWEAMEPLPDADEPDERVAHYQMLTALFTRDQPQLEGLHESDPYGPEECMFLLDPSLVSMSFAWFDAPCPTFFEWVHDPSHREPYEIYRKLLLYLQSTAPSRRLVLKSPAHFAQLTALVRAVPEARLIHTHRDPLRALASMCSVREAMMTGGVVGFDRQRIGRETLAGLEAMIARNQAQREQLPEGINFDLSFDELTRDPATSVQRVHAHFGLQWTAEASAALQAELARGLPPQVGQHRYALSDYGLDSERVSERLQDYRRRWGFA